MVYKQMPDDSSDQTRIKGAVDLRDDRLIPMLEIGLPLIKHPVHPRSEWDRAGDTALLSLDFRDRAARRGQVGNGLVLEELLRREPQARLMCFGDYLNGKNRITAKFKEVVVYAQPLKTEHFAPDTD